MYQCKAMDFMLVFIRKRRLIDKPIKKIINKETYYSTKRHENVVARPYGDFQKLTCMTLVLTS